MNIPGCVEVGLGTENRYQYGTGSNTTGTYPDRNATQISVLHFGIYQMKTPMSVSDTGQSLHWELGQFYMCPAESA